MSDSTIRGLTSIIVPCSNQVEFTQQCLAALRRHTREPWELIVVDNGSTDGTATYLAGVRDMAAVPVTVISNTKNLGFPAAINQGLKAARGEYLVMLNNDVVVTDGWLGQLIELANAKKDVSAETNAEEERDGRPAVDSGAGSGDPRTARSDGRPAVDSGAGSGDPRTARSGDLRTARPKPSNGSPHAIASPQPIARGLLPTTQRTIGLVGPMSNYAAPPQLVESVPYRDLRAMHGFARQWRDQHRGKWFMARKLSGFCLLMKRVVYETIGGLDERFGIGFFDDDDLAERARRAGFGLAVAQDLFVHHFGSRTFQGNGIDAEKLLDENARRAVDTERTSRCGVMNQADAHPFPGQLVPTECLGVMTSAWRNISFSLAEPQDTPGPRQAP